MADVLHRGLTRAGLAVDAVELGGEALIRAGATQYDAIVLDAMLPDIDGVEVCRRLRADRVWSPVLMLTARSGVPDRVNGLDPAGHRAWRGATSLDLSAKEFALLEMFMRHPGQVLSRFTLLEHAWEGDYENRSNVIDVHLRQLREKVDRPFGRESLQTVRGVGYRLCEP